MDQELRLKKIILYGVVMSLNQQREKKIKSFFGMYNIKSISVYNMRLIYKNLFDVHSGDTGYCPELFKAIGNSYAPFTLAAIPIGSFMPTKLMQHLHMGPEDAIKAHIDLGTPKLSVGIHWGTFMMSDEHYLAPRQVLEQVWNKYFTNEEDTSTNDDDEELHSIASSSSSTLIASSAAVTKIVNHSTKFITTAFGQTIILD